MKEYGEYKTNHGYGSSPMLKEGLLFVVCMHQGPSYVLAVDASSGRNRWKQARTFEPKDEAQDSFMSGQGNCVVVRAQPTFQVLATNELREATLSSPALSGGQIFLRAGDRLYCVR